MRGRLLPLAPLLLVLAVLLALTARLGVAAPGEGEVRLRLEVPPTSVRGPFAASERAILDAFLASHPHIRLDPFVRLRMEGPRGEATLYMSMAGRNAPDALYVNARAVQKYINQDFLYPLDEYLTDEIRNEPLFRKLLPTVQRGGNVYAIPAKVAVHALLYRKDLFAQAGLDPERPPATWDELLDAARRLTDHERGQYGLVVLGGANAGWRFANFVWQAGGEIVRPTADGWRLALDEPAALRALQFYRQLRWGTWEQDGRTLKGCLRVDSTGEEVQHVLQGRAAMCIVSTTGDVGRLIPDPAMLGLAPLPVGPGGAASMIEGEFWGINRTIADDPARRKAAWDYIRFVTGEPAQRIQTRTFVEAGLPMGVSPQWLQRFGYASELHNMPRAWVDLYDRILEHGRLEPFAPGYDQVATDVLSQLDDVLFLEHADPQRVLADITHRANTAFFSTTPEPVMRQRRTVARTVAVVFAGVSLVAGLWFIRRKIRGRRDDSYPVIAGPSGGAGRDRIRRLAWVFLFPAVVTILIWHYYPLVKGAALAFMDYRILGGSAYVGLDNFIDAFTQATFWRSLWQTLVYVAISLGIGFLVPILLAILLSEITWGRMLFRTVYYLPAVTSGLVVMFIWKLMYDGSAQGVFNTALRWMTSTTAGRWTTVLTTVAAWWVLTVLSAQAAAAFVRTRELPQLSPILARRRRLAPLGAVVVALAVWAECALSVAAASAVGEGASAPVAAEARPPVLFLIHGLARGAMVVGIVAMVALLLGRRPGAPKHTTYAAGGLALLLGVSLAVSLFSILRPMDRPYAWLQDPGGYWAMLWVILPGIWAGAGPGCIIYLAAIKSIPEELYEAADLDGASPAHKAYHITFQYLRPLILINFVGAFVGTFHAMESVLVMTGGGPGYKTTTISMDIFFNAFTHLRFGYATAEAWVMGSLLIGFTVYQLRVLKQMRFQRAK